MTCCERRYVTISEELCVPQSLREHRNSLPPSRAPHNPLASVAAPMACSDDTSSISRGTTMASSDDTAHDEVECIRPSERAITKEADTAQGERLVTASTSAEPAPSSWGLLHLHADLIDIVCANLRTRLSADTAASISILARSCHELHAHFSSELHALWLMTSRVRGAPSPRRPPGMTLEQHLQMRREVDKQQALVRRQLLVSPPALVHPARRTPWQPLAVSYEPQQQHCSQLSGFQQETDCLL